MAIFSAIGAAVGAVFTAVSTFIGSSAIGAFLLRTAVGIGLSLLAQKLAGKPDRGPDFSVSGRLQGGGDVPRTFGLGRFATAGSLVWQNTWGNAGDTPNAYFTQVVALSDMPTQSLDEVWINGEIVTLEASEDGVFGRPVASYRKDGVAHMWVKFYDGTQTAADQLCVTRASGSNGRIYESTRIGRGISYVVVTSFVGNQSGLFSGWPTYKFALTGMRLYDVSRDSTRGGSGTHRLGQPETWGGDGDHLPAVQMYNLLLGLRYGTSWFYGIQGMTANRLPVAHWISQIAKCRALISGPNGNEATYRAGGEVPVSAPLADTAEALLSTCQGRLAETGGFYKIHLGAPGTTVYAFTDGEIISTDGQSFTPFFGLADTINGITATHPSPEEGWNVKSAPPLYDATLEAQDGNRRLLADVPLDFVPYAGQVQRLMKSALQEARRARRHTFVLPPEAWVVEPGDVVQWTSTRNGYETKLFRVDGVIDRGNLDVMVDITEIDPADYDWDQEEDYRTPVDGPVGILRPAPQVIVDWFAQADAILDNEGRQRRPAIRLSWDGNQPDVLAVLFDVRLASTEAVVYSGRTDRPEAGQILISQGLTPNTLFEVRGRYVPRSDRETLWSGWLPVTTLDIRLGELDVYLEGVVEQINEFVGEATQWIGEGTRNLIDELLLVANTAADQELGNYDDRQKLRVELSAGLEQTRADYLLAIDVATGPGSAIVSRIETLEVTVEQDIATAVDALTTSINQVDGRVTANANAITALSAGSIGGNVATANFRMSVSAGPSGYASRIGLEARAGGAGSWRSASMFLDVPSNTALPTRIAFVADQFVITSSGATQQPFVFQSGELQLALARIGLIRSARLLSLNSRMDVDLDWPRIVISDAT